MSRDITRVLAAVCAVLCAATATPAMTVEEAYAEMQHRHAALDPASAGFGRDEAAYLSRLFELVDLAIVEKMEAWTWFQSEGRKGRSVEQYRSRTDMLVTRMAEMPAPDRLRNVQRLIVGAIRDQRVFFETWNEAVTVAAAGRDNREAYRARGLAMKSSSQKLHQAYAALMDLFPAAGQQNFDAFYDHLCVLDLL